VKARGKERESVADVEVRDAPGKGKGLFALRGFSEGETILHADLRGLKRYTLDEIAADPTIDGDHSHYAGRGKYVIEDGPGAYMNHSCAPNCVLRKSAICVYDAVALRDISEGEELTHDYAASSINQLEGLFYFEEPCNCGAASCRGVVHGAFFEMPLDFQRRYYPYLPPSIRRKYRAKFAELAR
jgi:hypothetical protein